MSLQLQEAFDTILTNFSKDLIPAESDLRDAKEVADKMFKILKKNRKYKIAHLGIMGSVEKKTALANEFDLDCVVFINDITVLNFPKVFDLFEQTLELETSISGIVFDSPKTSGVALQTTVNGFDFDIVPAIHYSKDFAVQRRRVLDEIHNLSHPHLDGYRFSSSLIHYQVEFIKRQSHFVHDLIRLAKYWNRSIFIEDYVAGRSTLIELVAVHAGNMEENNFNCDKSLLRAFRRFLEKMKNLKAVKIIFEILYTEDIVGDYLLKQRPLVMDPCNPFSNIAYDLYRKKRVLVKFEKFANVSIQRLADLTYDGLGSLFTLFAVQPSFLPLNFPNVHARSWVIRIVDNSSETKRFRIIERNERGNHEAVKIWKHYLCFNIRLFKNNAKTKQELRDMVLDVIDKAQNRKTGWVSRDASHSERDVTFEIPSGKWVIHCSFDI